MTKLRPGLIGAGSWTVASHLPKFAERRANLGSDAAESAGGVPEQATWTDPRNGGGYGRPELTPADGLALWLRGLRGASAVAITKAVLDAPVEHDGAGALRYDNGSIGTI